MKRAQISLFIIIGIIIIFVIGIIFFVRSQIISSNLQSQADSIISVPTQLRPVKEAIESCVSKVSSDGLTIIGLQGGYIDLPKDNIPRGLYNEFSNSVTYLPGVDTAYWFYEDNNGLQVVSIPSKKEMESQLNNYINNNMETCLSSLNDLRSQDYEIIPKSTITTKSNIQDQYVEILVDYPVDANYKNVGRVLNNHYAKINYPLGELYDLSTKIINKQNQIYYLENLTLDILEVYPDVPFSGQSLSCVPRVWTVQDINNNLKTHVSDNIQAITLKGSSYYNNNLYYQLVIDQSDNKVDFRAIYNKDWPFELSIDGGQEILKEDPILGSGNTATKILAGLFCLNSYNFIYDIKYPVIFELSKNNYNFQFATQTIIKSNQPKENRLSFNNAPSNENMFCKSTPNNISITVTDYETSQSLDLAEVSIKCITSSCNLGKTSSSGLELGVPSCINAELYASKEGYNPNSIITDTNVPGSINIPLKKKKPFIIEIKVIEDNNVRDLNIDEDVIVQFSNENDNYFTFANKYTESIELIQGTFQISSYLTVNSLNLTIEGSQVEKCVQVPRSGVLGLVGLKERKCFTTNIDPVNLDQVVSGGDIFEKAISLSDLNSYNTIVIYVTKNYVPRTVNELTQITQEIQNNVNKPGFRGIELQ